MGYTGTVNSFLPVLVYSTIAGSATILGLALILWQENWARRNSIYLISLAAGVLITSAFFHLLPEAIELTEGSKNISTSPYLYLLLGFGLLYIIEQIIVIHTCAEEECATHSFGIIAAVGIALHSLLDGFVIGVGFEVDFKIGLITSLAVLLHELPEGIFTLSILLHSKLPMKKAIWYTIVVALATPLGAFLSYFFLKDLSLLVLGNFLALAAGSFLYIAASDLIPQTHRISRKANVPLVILGSVFIVLISSVMHG